MYSVSDLARELYSVLLNGEFLYGNRLMALCFITYFIQKELMLSSANYRLTVQDTVSFYRGVCTYVLDQ